MDIFRAGIIVLNMGLGRLKLISYAILFCVSINGFSQQPCSELQNATAKQIFNEAYSDYASGRIYKASGLLREVIALEPGYAKSYYLLGMINIEKTNFNPIAAEKNFLKALELCPDIDKYAYYYLGQLAFNKKDYSNAGKYMALFTKEQEDIRNKNDLSEALKILEESNFKMSFYGNPVPFNPILLKGLSTVKDEYLIAISADEQLAFFTRKILEKENEPYDEDLNREKEVFMYSRRDSLGDFHQGYPMPYPFNQSYNEGSASLSLNNRVIYFTSCGYVSDYLNCDICYSEFRNGKWGPIQIIGNEINGRSSWESQPSISPDGSTLIFVSDRQGGLGGYDLWSSARTPDGKWTQAQNMGNVVNTRGNDRSPFLHPDGASLYYASDGHRGLGGYDLFISRLGSDGKWNTPMNLGYPINSEADETGLAVNAYGDKAYFASNKLKGPGGWDFYTFELYQGARPKPVRLLAGEVKTPKGIVPAKTRVEVKNLQNMDTKNVGVDQQSGRYATTINPNETYLLTAKSRDHVFASKLIWPMPSLKGYLPEIKMEIRPVVVGQNYAIEDILFDFDKFVIKAESIYILENMYDFLMEHPTVEIQIQGHTDIVGTDEYNKELSEQRARAVYDYLVSKGIVAERMSSIGFGSSLPVSTNDTEEGRARNRRTVMRIVKK
ncbi:MAG: OmpA family protein [Bacteroidales bacterium]|nr:OmpA family protein [Bacteroidales bacterium]